MATDTMTSPFEQTLELLRDLVVFDAEADPPRPLLEMREQPDRFELHAHVPGLRASEVRIVAHAHHLSLEADARRTRHRCHLLGPATEELRFARTFPFRVPVEVGRASAALRDGQLHVVLPKAHAAVHGAYRSGADDDASELAIDE